MPLTIFKRGEIWHYRGTVTGRLLRGSTGTADRETALRFINEKEGRQWKGHFDGPGAVLTFAQAVARYLDAGKPDRFVTSATIHLGREFVKDITPGAIQQAARELYPHAGNATRNRQGIVPIQSVINHAASLGLCSPIRVKRFTVVKKEKQPATWPWVEAFCEHANPHLAALAKFLYLTGARITEALAVRWADVDLENRRALVCQGKLGGEERWAHLPNELVIAIANIEPRKPRVFGYAMRKTAVKPWDKCIKRAGIAPLSFHALRHGFASGLLDKGVNPKTVAVRGGWKSTRHVFETYGHDVASETITDLLISTPQAQTSPKSLKVVRK